MKYKIKARLPSSFAAYLPPPEEYEFDTIDQLKQIPFVASFIKAFPERILFKDRMKSEQQILIISDATGKDFLCIGWLYNSYDLELPIK